MDMRFGPNNKQRCLFVCCLFCCLLFQQTPATDESVPKWTNSRQRRSGGGGRVGDMCTQNTDCQSGMFCQLGQCQCLSNHVPIASFCWPKVNPGDSGCVEDVQCEAVWPGARCTRSGLCECADHLVPAKTRDGTVCVTSGVPPACPLPEPNSPEAPSPATLLANPSTHPLAPDSYMPVLCTSQSTEVTNSNGGDGSSWCIYPDGDKDLFIADLYNCVPHPQVQPDYFPEYAPSVDGICCHSRALVCIQPMSQGEEPSIPRWWYNSITGTCTQFLWDPTQSDGVSPNNFRTLEHCESYCRDTCRRGSAQFQRHQRAAIPDEIPVTNCARQSGVCAPENSCTQIGSGQLCCPTIASVCSATGGRSPLPLGSLVAAIKESFDPGAQIAGASTTTRFYYDAEQGRCANFLYAGGLGNFNNFGTKQDCENFCSKLVCEFGQPLRVAEGQWQRCESSSDCPNAYQCDSGHKVCCPTAQTICSQPKRVGECTGSVNRYWYNAATRQCELFDYTGCQGNDNNFDQLMECQLKCRNISPEPKCPQGRAHRDLSGQFARCSPGGGGEGGGCPPNHECHFDGAVWGCCPTRGWTCSLGADRGVQCGAGRSFRFFFDADKQSCESFQYEGCDGNANNFQSLESCQDYCGVGGCPNGGQPQRDPSNNQFLSCSAQQPCPGQAEGSHECVLVNAHGSVAHRCCATKIHICSQPPQPGLACRKGQLTRWYFNLVTRECGKFGYNGCSGNLNNFESQEQCQNFCSSSACSPGELVFRRERDHADAVASGKRWLSPGSSRDLVECEPALQVSVCPRDFRCIRDQLAHRHVCCGAPPSDVCPPGEKPLWNALDESVRECQAHLAGSCPADFLCRFSAPHNKYFCCAPRNGTLCPEGRSLYRQPKSSQPQRCVINGDRLRGNPRASQCPDGFSCQSRVPRDIQGHCCSAQALCKGAVPFLVDERTQQPRLCIPGSFAACPEAFHCEKNAALGGTGVQGICCKGAPVELLPGTEKPEKSDGCPPGESALSLGQNHEEIAECDPFNPRDKSCPRNYTCQYARMHQRYQCCAKRDILNGTRHSLPSLLGKGGGPSTAAGEGGAVETDPGKGCPVGQVAAVELQTGLARPCTVSAPNSCPLGFSCQFSDRNSQFQCCAHPAGCPGHSVAFVDSAGQPSLCSVQKPRPLQCPPGYLCRRSRGAGGNVEICCTLGEESSVIASSTEGPIVGPRDRQRPKEKTTASGGGKKKCRPNERLLNGHCRARRLGDACLVDEHCLAGMECRDFACACPPGHRPKNEWECEPELPRKSKTTSRGGKRSGRIEGEEEETRQPRVKCRTGEILVDGECLPDRLSIGQRCRRSAQCRWNGANCVSSRCHCTGGQAAHRNKCHGDVCGDDHFRRPQLGPLGEAVQCGDQPKRCAWPHRCSFSRPLHTYICCRSADPRIGAGIGRGQRRRRPANPANSSAAPSLLGLLTLAGRKSTLARPTIDGSRRGGHFGREKADRRCADGSRPLLFPGSNSPVQCSARRRCPANFTCWRQLCCRRRPLRLSVRRLPAISTWHVYAKPAAAATATTTAITMAEEEEESKKNTVKKGR